MMNDSYLQNFSHFLSDSPTSYHAVQQIKIMLLKHNFKELVEEDNWNLKAKNKYFLIRDGSLIAFIVPEKSPTECLVYASHTDSPALKLKPKAEYIKEGMVMLGVEVYGGPLLSSWLNRDLGIAGKVLYLNKKNKVKEALVNLTKCPVTIPQVAIHLDRKVNEDGLILNKQENLNALAAIKKEKKSFLIDLLSQEIDFNEILAHDLFLYPLEKPALLGENAEFLASYRLDSLASVFPILTAFVDRKASKNQLQMMAFWDHEEIGSQTATGAESPFFGHALERILLSLNLNRENYLRLLKNSLCLSIDLGHAVHPNYAEKHDPQHKPQLGQGVIIKTSAQKKYATDIQSIKCVIECSRKNDIPLQIVASRSDIPSGTTIGPIQAALTGIPTVDLGIPQLSMHSTRELISTADLLSLKKLLTLL